MAVSLSHTLKWPSAGTDEQQQCGHKKYQNGYSYLKLRRTIHGRSSQVAQLAETAYSRAW